MADCEHVENENHLDIADTSLLSLDDMVLFKIMKHLHILDLTNLAETCTRLASLTNVHFGKNHSSINWVNHRDVDKQTIKPSESERVFKQIGKHVKTIKLSLWADFEFYEILVILAQQCSQMDTLVLESIRMSRPLTLCDPLICLMFGKLKRFVLSGCFWMGWCPLDIFFGNNSTLEDLSVVNCCAYNGTGYRLQLGGFQSLKKLRLLRCRNVITETELQVCFKNNKLRLLMLTDIGATNIFYDNVIDSLFDTVDDLTVDYITDIDLEQLARLTKLKALRLRCNVFRDCDDLLLKLSPDNLIEELVITNICISTVTIEALENFKKLTRLRFDHSINTIPRLFFRSIPKILPQLQQLVYSFSSIRDEDIIYMFKLLPKLNRLSLFGCNSLAIKTYLEMVKILADDWHRPKLELITPKWETMKSLQANKSITKNIELRTDINK